MRIANVGDHLAEIADRSAPTDRREFADQFGVAGAPCLGDCGERLPRNALATIRNPRLALAYLLLFGIGTPAGMALITVSMASALRILGIANGKWSQRLALVSGLLSVAFGGLVAIQILLVNGLFTGHPIWTPK
jgi:hypothetical protein